MLNDVQQLLVRIAAFGLLVFVVLGPCKHFSPLSDASSAEYHIKALLDEK
jgi:hypothetical protein